jgi:general secretion pathway protein K
LIVAISPRNLRREHGFALLIVLWSLVLIGFLTTQILASGRTALTLAGGARAVAVARASDDGAINEALFHVLSFGPQHWLADGTPHLINNGGMIISVQVQSLAGKINPNLASAGLLSGLFQAVGAAPDAAAQMASAIIAWRSIANSKDQAKAILASYRRARLAYGPPAHNFADLSELSAVIGMQPALLAQALPHMSLYQSGDPDPKQADPQVRRALALAGKTGPGSSNYQETSPVIVINAETQTPSGLILRRTAIISTPGADSPVPFQFLSLIDG